MFWDIFKKKRQYNHYLALCCIIKDEIPYLKEWIEYHSFIGVSKFYIYENECSSSVEEFLLPYIEQGLVHVEHISGKGMQLKAYNNCLKKFKNEAQWIGFIDVDEFIVPKSNPDLRKFLKDYEDFGGLGINWLVFGSNGHITKPIGLQTKNFTKRSLSLHPTNQHIKTIVQTKHVKKARTPHHFSYKIGKICVDENKKRIKGPFSINSTGKIQINHYYLRSLQEFKEKMIRGMGDGGGSRTLNNFYDMDRDGNLVTDESIIKLWNPQ